MFVTAGRRKYAIGSILIGPLAPPAAAFQVSSQRAFSSVCNSNFELNTRFDNLSQNRVTSVEAVFTTCEDMLEFGKVLVQLLEYWLFRSEFRL